MVDCQWNGGSRVSLGQKCQLASGLMEITYDTGAKVILQGPVTYEVEANGGYLAVGKLTGKLEKKGSGVRGQGAETRNQKSPDPPSLTPYPFVIRTPTATVADLGTEFGVEVNRDGVTEAHVFVGAVKIVASRDQNNSSREQIIHAGNAARVSGSGNQLMAIPSCERRFVRMVPLQTKTARSDTYAKLVLSMKPFAYYRMEEPKSGLGADKVCDVAPGAHDGSCCWQMNMAVPHGDPDDLVQPSSYADGMWMIVSTCGTSRPATPIGFRYQPGSMLRV